MLLLKFNRAGPFRRDAVIEYQGQFLDKIAAAQCLRDLIGDDINVEIWDGMLSLFVCAVIQFDTSRFGRIMVGDRQMGWLDVAYPEIGN